MPPAVDTIVLVVVLSTAVGVTLAMSEALLALDGTALTIHGISLMALAAVLGRWADTN